ncbi:PDGLE domain-containing protein, partial [Streptomyces acidicola]
PVPVAALPHSRLRSSGRDPHPRKLLLAGLVTSLLLAGFVSFYASANPDGLEKVAADKGIDAKTEDHASADSPLADYGVQGITDTRLSGGLAGVIGVGFTVVVGTGIFWAVRRRRTGDTSPASVSDIPENA